MPPLSDKGLSEKFENLVRTLVRGQRLHPTALHYATEHKKFQGDKLFLQKIFEAFPKLSVFGRQALLVKQP
jgi:hypothetical protein